MNRKKWRQVNSKGVNVIVVLRERADWQSIPHTKEVGLPEKTQQKMMKTQTFEVPPLRPSTQLAHSILECIDYRTLICLLYTTDRFGPCYAATASA